MNPLSPFTYTRRHKGLSFALTALLALTVAGLYLFIGLAQETYIAPAYAINGYLGKFSLVQPDQVPALDPDAVARIRANPDVALALPEDVLTLRVTNIGGAGFLFRLIGLRDADQAAVLDQSGVSVKAGRLPQPGTNEVALSEEIAAALHLDIGDTFDRTKDEKTYPNILIPLRVVGILHGEVRLGILSYEYLQESEVYRSLVDGGLLVIARPGREEAVGEFLRQSIRNPQTKTYTLQSVSEQTAQDQALLYTLGLPIVLLVATAITLVISAVNRLAFARRLEEFGTLHALGIQKGWLVRRLILETAGPAIVGLAAGILLAWGGLALLNAAVYTPRGFGFSSLPLTALPFVLLVPLAVIGSALWTAMRALARLDSIAVVERGLLTMEADRSQSAAHRRSGSSPRPLASITYYRRHPREGAVLAGAALLLIVGTALLFFLFAAGADAMQPALNNLSRMSAVSPNNQELDPALIDRIRANPAVERIIGVYAFVSVKISIPPIFPDSPIETLCVNAEDMAYLVSLYKLQLEEGRLPHPGTNEIVIPWAVAKNRNLHVGDVIGDPAHPAYPNAPSLPVAIVVSGIFAPAVSPADETWLSFMSLEYVEPLRESALSILLVPKPGEKAALDAWLTNRIAEEGRIVLTYGNQQAAMQRSLGSMLFTFLLMESIVTLVAALALAGLNYFFITQRQAEFGVLHALGFLRRNLTGRIVREMSAAIGAAWLMGLAFCLTILLFLQYYVFAAAGLRLNILNPLPWLFTLPIPAAVLGMSAVTGAWMLSRVDPIAIIERRT